MIYGIAGASGTGKTTLAKKVAEELGAEFFPASISELGKEIGLSPVSDMDLETRIRFQAKLLDALIGKIRELDPLKVYIMDRTPLDTIGYLMAEVNMHSDQKATPETLALANKLVELAQSASAHYFGATYQTAPLADYSEAETRPRANPAYQQHVHMLIAGAVFAAPRTIRHTIIMVSDLEARTKMVVSDIQAQQQALTEAQSPSALIH